MESARRQAHIHHFSIHKSVNIGLADHLMHTRVSRSYRSRHLGSEEGDYYVAWLQVSRSQTKVALRCYVSPPSREDARHRGQLQSQVVESAFQQIIRLFYDLVETQPKLIVLSGGVCKVLCPTGIELPFRD
jgi:hypothetical protein